MVPASEATSAKIRVMARFDKDASGFDFERTAVGYRLRHQLVKGLIMKESTCGAFAFDVGCGTAEYTISLAEAGFAAVGGDISKGMLTIAQSKIKNRGLMEKIHLVRLESTRLPFRNESFSTVSCIAVLDWLPDAYKFFLEANRVLKHEAVLIACMDASWSPYKFIENILFAFRPRQRRYVHLLNAVELRRALTLQGLVVEKFLGDVLLGQVITRWLYDPEQKTLANKLLRITEAIDSRLRSLSVLRFLSEHYIIEARKK